MKTPYNQIPYAHLHSDPCSQNEWSAHAFLYVSSIATYFLAAVLSNFSIYPRKIIRNAAFARKLSSCLFFVLCSYLGRSHHQADACHMASVHLGFCSIWNTHFCLRLQPHLYPVPVATSVGRSDGTRQRYKSTHV